jgi:hypothetical protein
MKTDISQALWVEHRLILRMIALLEKNAPQQRQVNMPIGCFILAD